LSCLPRAAFSAATKASTTGLMSELRSMSMSSSLLECHRFVKIVL
jgi:hypothetical protein